MFEELRAATRGTKNRMLKRELEYFIKNRSRLCYQEVINECLPIGSGAIESVIRRVVNLRLKSPCIFWHDDTAEEILLLRAYYKTGRWSMLKTMAYRGGLLAAA